MTQRCDGNAAFANLIPKPESPFVRSDRVLCSQGTTKSATSLRRWLQARLFFLVAIFRCEFGEETEEGWENGDVDESAKDAHDRKASENSDSHQQWVNIKCQEGHASGDNE